MANIISYVNRIKTALYGKDVRGSLASGLEAVNKETEVATSLSTETKKRQDNLETRWDLVVAETTDGAEIIDMRVDMNGVVHTNAKARADSDYKKTQDKINDKLAGIVNVKEYEHLVVKDGEGNRIDWYPAFKAALASGASKVVFPNWIMKFKSSIIIPSTVKEIDFAKAKLLYEKEQNIVAPRYEESAFVALGIPDLTIAGGSIEYVGTFNFGTGSLSYKGMVSAIYVEDCQNIIIEKVEASKFNCSGINIAAGATGLGGYDYTNNPKVLNCNLHHNRVAGVSFGDTKGIEISSCKLEYNGLPGDSSTGYGCASWQHKRPYNSIIHHNQANYNYRKGIDFHSGYNGIIDNNYCIGNTYYGIYTVFDNGGADAGQWKITKNIVSDMMLDGEISTVYPIVFGLLKAQGNLSGKKTSFLIDGNTIHNIDTVNGAVSYMILGSGTNLFDICDVLITNNIIDVGNINGFFRANEDTTKNSGNRIDIKITNNVFKAKSVSETAFAVRKNSNVRNMDILNNTIEISDVYAKETLCNFADAIIAIGVFNFNNNTLIINKVNWGDYDPVAIYGFNNIKCINNTWNGKQYRDWDGKKYVFTSSTFNIVGHWTRSSIIYNDNTKLFGAIGSQFIVTGWTRITNGTGNTLNVDWVENRVLTGT
ncbi:right-handed parallel beta-helix repeat-containing protein [Bacillus mobilis]|uniref:right-handed parallel beta-helix repeat-containing protein n=1 Tax=Bacillus mobilis TaxID=2026190 RepID=UPI00330EDB2A|nr:right-handed parallel beta-helix repeat-containing protein [Bacillus mobilis]